MWRNILRRASRRMGIWLKDIMVSYFRNLEKDFLPIFKKEECLIYCTNVYKLINTLKVNIYQSNEWRFFFDSDTRCQKEVLLHNTNKLVAIPIAHSKNMPENYDSLKLVLKKIKYSEHNCRICGDLKIISYVVGIVQTARTIKRTSNSIVKFVLSQARQMSSRIFLHHRKIFLLLHCK